MDNQIKNLKTVNMTTTNGPTHLIMMGLDILDISTIEEFIRVVVRKFQQQKMISPPDTSTVLITIIGDISAIEFKKLWNQTCANDVIMKIFRTGFSYY